KGKCRQAGCPNTFDEVVGGDGWGPKVYGDCMPCLIAAQMLSAGATLEIIQDTPQMLALTLSNLENCGWTWQHLIDSYGRAPVIM
ncbi:hypothetical protein LCGC14_2072560, partial [marine sediment metagenome]